MVRACQIGSPVGEDSCDRLPGYSFSCALNTAARADSAVAQGSGLSCQTG